jgi:hypothetical protein
MIAFLLMEITEQKFMLVNKGNNKITEQKLMLVLIQRTISLEMPVPSHGHYSFPVVD